MKYILLLLGSQSLLTLHTASAESNSYAEFSNSILNEISALSQSTKAIDVFNDTKRFEPAAAENAKLFESAKAHFNKGAFSSVIPELVAFIQASHSIEPTQNLQVQSMLAFAYRKVGNFDQAARAYLRYLETQRQHSILNKDEFNDVVEELIRICKIRSVFTEKDGRRLLTALAGMQVPDEERAQLLFHASDVDIASPELQSEWLSQSMKLSKDLHLKLRILYKQAALAHRQNNNNEMFATLNRLIETAKGLSEPDEIVDRAVLSLARARAGAGQNQQSVKLLESIGTNSTVARERDYDLIFVLRDTGDVKRAYEQATKYLAKYSTHSSALQIVELVGLFAIEANDLKGAELALKEYLDRLSKYRSELLDSTSQIEKFDFTKLVSTAESVTGTTGLPEVIQQISDIELRLTTTIEHLQNMEGNLRHEIFAISQLQIDDYNPRYKNLSKIYRKTLHNHLETAHKFLAHSRIHFSRALGGSELAVLESIEKKRIFISTRIQEWISKRDNWTQYANLEMLRLDLIRQAEEFATMRKELASIKLSAALREGPNGTRTLDVRLQKLATRLADQLSDIEVRRLRTLPRLSSFAEVIAFHREYSGLVHEELAILGDKLKTVQDDKFKLSKQDFTDVSRHWQYTDRIITETANTLYENLDAENSRTSTHYDFALKSLKKLQSLSMADELKLYQLKLKYMATMEELVLSQIDRKATKYRKWLADSYWLQSINAREYAAKERSQIEVSRLLGPIFDEGI